MSKEYLSPVLFHEIVVSSRLNFLSVEKNLTNTSLYSLVWDPTHQMQGCFYNCSLAFSWEILVGLFG